MPTLYISDLDGTLLDPEGRLSGRSHAGLVELLGRGLCFTVATARSSVSVRERFDVPLTLPVITANGTFVDVLHTGEHLHVAALPGELARRVLQEGRRRDVDVLVTTSSTKGDRMFFPQDHGSATETFLLDRLAHSDPRTRVVPPREIDAAVADDAVASLVAIDRAEVLRPLADALIRDHGPRLSVYLADDHYQRGYQWLTVQDAAATKGRAIDVLRGAHAPRADRLVVFGDQDNDLPMFEIADHAVATANADPDVKAAADEIIGHHAEDTVVRWLLANAEPG